MAKILYDTLTTDRRKEVDRLLRSALLTPKQRKEMADLFCDLLTPSERLMIVRRLQVAQRLLLGKSHFDIREELGVGWELIATVHRWLDEKLDAYRSVIPELLAEGETRAQQKRRKGEKPIKGMQRRYHHLSFHGIRKRYPAAYLLINMLIDNEW